MTTTDYSHLVADLLVASSVEGAIAYLATHNGHALLMAGGTDMLPDLSAGAFASNYLVDVSHVCSMKQIAQHDGHLLLGGSVTFSRLGASELVERLSPLLYQVGMHMANPEVRQRATVAGNIACAVGNADGAVALMALDAEVEITNLTGAQWLSVSTLFAKRGLLRIDDDTEIITGVRVPIWEQGQGVALERYVLASHQRPRLLLAVVLSSTVNETIDWMSVVVGGCVGVPMHLDDLGQEMMDLPMGDPETRDLFCRGVSSAVEKLGLLGDDSDALVGSVVLEMAARAYERAREMAHSSLQKG